MSLDKGRKCEEKAIKKEKTKKFQLFLKKVLHFSKKCDMLMLILCYNNGPEMFF